jgi:tetratricopeptide (TPR) repeat protein
VELYRQLEGRLKGPAMKAEAAGKAADTLLTDLRRWDDAEKELQRILKTYATSGAEGLLRRTHSGLGDILRHRGDGPKARQEYAAAAAARIAQLPPNEAAVRVGTLSRYVEEYTRQKQWEWVFKYLADWAWEFPPDKLQGHWSYLRADALDRKGDRAAALEEATDLLAANPASPYAVRLLMLAAECNVAAGQTDKARLLLQTAVEDYPEDPLQDAARKRLKTLGGPLPADAKTPKKAAP